MTRIKDSALAPVGAIAQSILILRGHRVLLDADLAVLYGVTTARLNQQVRRNLKRFPRDFMFQLTAEEHTALMLQSATSKPGRGGRRKLPLAFTEHGAIMAATVLNSPRAVEMGIYVVRVFIQLRDLLNLPAVTPSCSVRSTQAIYSGDLLSAMPAQRRFPCSAARTVLPTSLQHDARGATSVNPGSRRGSPAGSSRFLDCAAR